MRLYEIIERFFSIFIDNISWKFNKKNKVIHNDLKTNKI